MTQTLPIMTFVPALSPLVLESIRIHALEMNEEDTRTTKHDNDNTLTITQSINDETETCAVVIDMNIAQETSNGGIYNLHTKVEGKYGFRPDVPDEIKAKLVIAQPVVNLLGFIRGMVYQATAMLPCGPIMVPLIDLGHDKSSTPASRKSKPRGKRIKGGAGKV